MIITRGFIELLKNDCEGCETKNQCDHITEQECFDRIHSILEKIKEMQNVK